MKSLHLLNYQVTNNPIGDTEILESDCLINCQAALVDTSQATATGVQYEYFLTFAIKTGDKIICVLHELKS